mgnify:CR=1 FL=1
MISSLRSDEQQNSLFQNSNLKSSEKVGIQKEKKPVERKPLVASSSTSSLHEMQKGSGQISFQNKQEIVSDDLAVNDDEDLNEPVQSWNEKAKNSPIRNSESSQNQVKSPPPAKTKQAKTPFKISTSKSSVIPFKTRKLAGTPQRKPPQNRQTAVKRNFVH